MKNRSKNELPKSYEDARYAILQALGDKKNKVVALTGKWGTGKTHLWDEISASPELAPSKHIYISLFGSKAASELKLRVLQDAYLKDKGNFKKIARTGGSVLGGLAQTFLGVALEDAALLWLPNLIKERLIAIDDIERKHAAFDVDELLGFIDEYSERHDVQFLLLLNSDKLVDKESWAVLHEKVIDLEIVLDPTAADAYVIASQAYAGPFKAEIGSVVERLNIKNIRILQKILTTFDNLAAAGLSTAASIAKRVVPSTVLLTAIHYRGLDEHIPMEYVRTYQRVNSVLKVELGDKNEKARWNTLLLSLDIQGADDYEDVVSEFLARGLVDSDRLGRVLERYRGEASHDAMNSEVGEFMESFWWDQRKSRDTLLAEADGLSRHAPRLSPLQISEIVGVVEQLKESQLAEKLLTAWISASDARVEYRQLTEDSFTAGYGRFHPRIAAQLMQLKQKYIPKMPVDEAIRRIHANSGWGQQEQRSLRESTVAEYHDALCRLNGRDLARFLFEHIDWLRDGPSDGNFVTGVSNFKAACAQIAASEPEGRLTHMLIRTFKDRGATEHIQATIADVNSQYA
jgi:hypothetical protein